MNTNIRLDKETEGYLIEFQNIHNQHKVGSKTGTNNFGELIASLGNFYEIKMEELLEKNTGEELSEKLLKLEVAYTIYNDARVLGDVKELGTIANELHFTFSVAKSERYIKEAMQAVKEGKSAKSAVKRDITQDDKNTVSEVLNSAKNVLTMLTKFYNEKKSQIFYVEDVENLDKFIKENLNETSWTFSKLVKYFEMLDKIKGDKEDRYLPEQFSEVVKTSEIIDLFSEEEVNMFTELYRIYNQI